MKNGPEWHRPESIDTNRMFVVLTILRFLLHRVAPQSAWRDRLFAQFDRFPDVPLASMGMDAGWHPHTLWRWGVDPHEHRSVRRDRKPSRKGGRRQRVRPRAWQRRRMALLRQLPGALVHNSRSRSIIALHPEIRGPA